MPRNECFFIDFARLTLSALRVPIRIIASPYSATCSIKKRDVGFIFILSVHQRKVLLGTGYPRPITFTQKESSNRGIVLFTYIGISWQTAAVCIFPKTLSTYFAIIGFSTKVSLQTTYTQRCLFSSGILLIAYHTN